jgi:hypothetical protein
MAGEKDKPKTNSGNAAGTGAPKSANFDEILSQLAASGGAAQGGGTVFTEQEASAYVQAVYQQLLGRNAVGVEYRKGVNAFLSQSQDTGVSGRQQAIESMVSQALSLLSVQKIHTLMLSTTRLLLMLGVHANG